MQTDTHETRELIASDKVEGTAVYNREGERLGTVERFMVNKRSGKAEFAVMSFGGLFGLGHSHYPLPWQTLTYDTERGGYVVDVSKEQLEQAPRYDADEPSYDPDYGRQVYGYYGLAYA